jgi:hypothetical protein
MRKILTGLLLQSLFVSWSLVATASTAVDEYKKIFPLKDGYEKLTNNRGNGFEGLYGTRNFRVVLHGVAYRGGANNMFHRDNKRDNMNPLPNDGLENLCKFGFSQAVYLYKENFETAPVETFCQTKRASNVIAYSQLSPNVQAEAYETLRRVYEVIKGRASGPIYLHCWNGWHFSGMISAFTLRQFCGVSGDDAVAYWDANTDGNNKEPQYESLRRRIRAFSPYPEFQITPSESAAICPVL